MDFVNVLTWEVEQSFKLASGCRFYDIAKLEVTNAFALGLWNGGVQTVYLRRTGNNFHITELTHFLEDENVLCIQSMPKNCLLVGFY